MEFNSQVKKDDYSQARDDEQKISKSIQAYKDTMTLIKLKMTKADALIRQYNDKLKECEMLNDELTSAKNEKQDILCKYNLTQEKVTRLELENIDFKSSVEKYKETIEKQTIKLEENEKHINQLVFKIKDLEDRYLALDDMNKNLHQEMKTVKIKVINEKKPNVPVKHVASQTLTIEKRDASVNVDIKKEVSKKDKRVITDECISIRKDPFPIFCAKCEAHIQPAPIDQILKIMTPHPPLLSAYISPPHSTLLNKPSTDVYEPIETDTPIKIQDNNEYQNLPQYTLEEYKSPVQTSEKSNYSSFMEMDKLSRKVNKLESLMKEMKKTKKESYRNTKKESYRKQNCCSKNIKFVVQIPNQEKLFEFQKRKIKKLNRLNRKSVGNKRKGSTETNKWQVENYSGSQKTRAIPQLKKKLQKKRKLIEDDLFESPESFIPKVRPNINDRNSVSPCTIEESLSASQSSDLQSLNTIPIKTVKKTVHRTQKSITQNVNIDDFATKSVFLSCNPTTSQALECKNIYQNVDKDEVQNKDLVSSNVCKNNALNTNNNLSISLMESIDEELQSIASPDEDDEENEPSPAETVINKLNDNKNVFIEQSEIKNIKISNPNDSNTAINQSSDLIYFSESSSQIVEKNIYQNTAEEKTDQRRNSEDSQEPEKRDIKDVFALPENRENTEDLVLLNLNYGKTQDINLSEASNSTFNITENLFTEQSSIINNTIESVNESSILPNESSEIKLNLTSEITDMLIDNNIHKEIIEQENKQELNFKTETEDNSFKSENIVPSMIENTVNSDPTVSLNINEIEVSNSSMHKLDDETLHTEKNNELSNESPIWISSDESSESRFFSASGLKRAKSNFSSNVILSEDSSEGQTVDAVIVSKRKKVSENSKRRQKRTENRKKLLTKIRNIKKNSKKPIIFSKSEPSLPQVKDEPFSNLSIPVQQKSKSSLSTKLRSVRAQEISTVECIPVKKQRIAHTPKSINISHAIEVFQLAPTESFNSLENKNVTSTSSIEINSVEDVKSDNVLDDLKTEEAEYIEDAPIVKNADTVHNTYKSEDLTTVILLPQESTVQDVEEREIVPSVSVKNVISLLEKTGTSQKSKQHDNKKKEANTQKRKSPIRELRSRHVVIKEPATVKKKKAKPKPFSGVIDETNSSLSKTLVVSELNEYITNPNKSNNSQKKLVNNSNAIKDKNLIQAKLDLLMVEQWTNETNTQTIHNLLDFHDLRTIALNIIDYAVRELTGDEPFDRSHTPPAPIMTEPEQKLITLIMGIEKLNPGFSDIITSGIQFNLFSLRNSPQEVQIVERLFRILVVLNKIKKDREKVRIFCCDALYCLNLRAINIIYVALTCWPEILPKHDSNNDIIVKTIVHVIMTLKVSKPFPKLCSLRKLLSTYYEYPNSGYMTNIFKVEILKNLQENVPGINTAVLLLCKKMGPDWSSENIITGLKQMIVAQVHSSLYEALTLLGNVLRPYPKKDPNNRVGEIIDQLCDVLARNEGADDLQEGVVSCLLSLSINKDKYEQIARSVIKWQSNKNLRASTKDKLNSLFKQRDAKWWWKFVKENFPLPK